MYRTKVLIFLLLICLPVLIFAQEEEQEEEPIIEQDRDFIFFRPVPGDQAIMMSAGTVFPIVFFNNGKEINHNFNPPVGGNLFLSYNYFLTSDFFVGGEVSFVFIPTLGRNTAYFVPLGIKAGYQLNIWRLEFPFSLSLGMVWHRYLDLGYYGLYLKAGASAFFRFNEDWSFGINSAFGWYPEWTQNSENNYDSSKNVDGFIVDLTLSVRYHF